MIILKYYFLVGLVDALFITWRNRGDVTFSLFMYMFLFWPDILFRMIKKSWQ